MIGIYSITNIVNNKRYIGQSKDIKQRWNNHKATLRRHVHDNAHLQSDYDIYGPEYFKYEVLEECNIDELIEREIYWVSFFDAKNSGYNMTVGGTGLVEPTDDVRSKISKGLKGEKNGMYGVRLVGEKNPNYGKPHSEEVRHKISERAKERYSDSNFVNPLKKAIKASTGEVFDSAVEAAKWLGLSDGSAIGKCCKGQAKSAGRHPITGEKIVWKYCDDLK